MQGTTVVLCIYRNDLLRQGFGNSSHHLSLSGLEVGVFLLGLLIKKQLDEQTVPMRSLFFLARITFEQSYNMGFCHKIPVDLFIIPYGETFLKRKFEPRFLLKF